MSDFNFFSFLWIKRTPVFDASAQLSNFNYLTDENGNILTDENGVPLIDQTPTVVISKILYRWV